MNYDSTGHVPHHWIEVKEGAETEYDPTEDVLQHSMTMEAI